MRNEMMKKEKIYCFDFDGTLTKKDTLIEFIKFSMGKTRFLMGFLLYSPILVLMKLHLFPNWKAKQIIFKHFFGGMSIEDFDDYCVNFAAKNLYLLRLNGIGKIQEAKRKKERVLIVSASIDNWVKPFFVSVPSKSKQYIFSFFIISFLICHFSFVIYLSISFFPKK
jgi:phosphatidylglycerophosphatase C